MTDVTESDRQIQRAVRLYHASEPDRIKDVCLGDCHVRTTNKGHQVVVLADWSGKVLASYDIDGAELHRRPTQLRRTS